jgi:hypothetical protein
LRSKSRSRGGQLRVLEATIASIVVFFSFLTVSYFTRNPRVWTTSRAEDLTRMGYNVLHSLSVTGVLDNIVASGKIGWEQDLKFVLDALLPSTSYYNMSVYKVLSSETQEVGLSKLNSIKITNAESGSAFIYSPEVISVSYLFTSMKGDVYLLVLQLAEIMGETTQ